MKSFGMAAVIGSIVALVSACSLASPTYISSADDPITGDDAGPTGSGNGSAGGGSSSGGSDAGGGKCQGGSFVKVDVSTLTACNNGKGHCYDAASFPYAAQANACADKSQVCVPDKILESGGAKLKACTSPVTNAIGNGACMPSPGFFPQMDTQGAGFLKQDVCDADEVCVPCVNPLDNNKPTGFCDAIGVYGKCEGGGSSSGGTSGSPPPPPPPPAQLCCTTNGHSNGTCVSKAAVPASMQSQVKQDVCTGDNICAPTSLVTGKPVVCSSLLGSGVCMDKCFNDMMAIAGDIGFLSSKGCGTTELCIPCALVSGKGVPGCN